MSREDSFRMHVHILPNNKWVCNFCGYEYSGDTTRIRAHLAGVAGYGIQGCENVDSQVRSKALTAWKGKRPAKSSNRQRYLGGGPHLRATPNDEDDCIVTSFAALPDLTSDVISTVAPSSSAFLPLPETVKIEDDWTVTSPVARPDPSSGVMSTVNASSSAFLPLPKTNLPNQSLPPQNMNPQRDFPFWPRRPQSHAVDSYHLPRSLSHLIRVIRQPDLVSKDLTNMLRLANAKVEEHNTKVPQGTFSRDRRKKINYRLSDRKVEFEGRIDNIRSNSDELMKLNSLPDGGIGWRKIGKIYVSRKEIAKGSNGTIVLEGIYEDRPVAVKRLVRAHCDVASNEIQILLQSDRHKNIVRYHGVESNSDFVYLALERCACSLYDLIQAHSDSSNNSAFRGDPASTDDHKIKLDSVRDMMRDVDLWRADGHPSPLLQKLMRNVVSGLSHLHDLRIIHRDLKPQNVLITKNRPFCAQLSDMGISKCLPEDKSSLGYHATDDVRHPTTCVQHVGVRRLASGVRRLAFDTQKCGMRQLGCRHPASGGRR